MPTKKIKRTQKVFLYKSMVIMFLMKIKSQKNLNSKHQMMKLK